MGIHIKFMGLLMFGTVMLMANGAAAQNSVKPFHLDEATISDVHAAYKSGALTSVRLVQAYLERIRACDQAGPKLNVVIFLNPRALEVRGPAPWNPSAAERQRQHEGHADHGRLAQPGGIHSRHGCRHYSEIA